MRIIEKESMCIRLSDLLTDVYRRNKEVDYIELTEFEAVRLHDELRPFGILNKEDKVQAMKNSTFQGHPIKVLPK